MLSTKVQKIQELKIQTQLIVEQHKQHKEMIQQAILLLQRPR
jgi:hypothetical protein